MSDRDQLINIFVENWTSVYNTILGRDVIISVDSVESKSKGEGMSALDGFQSLVSLTYSDTAADVMVIGLKNKLVSIISNMMIGLDSFKDEITADDKDAFVEAVNQMFSSCQVPLKETLDLDMRFRDISFVEKADAEVMVSDENVQIWNVTMNLPDVAVENFILVTPSDFGVTEKEDVHTEEITLDTGMERPASAGPAAPAGYGAMPMPEYETGNIGLLMDVELPITVRIGSTEMKLIDIMRLGLGSIIELEKMVDDPVEILANEKLVAKGEVVVCDGNYAVKITEVESREDRIRSLG